MTNLSPTEEVFDSTTANTLSVSPGPYFRRLRLAVTPELIHRRFYLGFHFDAGATVGLFQAEVNLWNGSSSVGRYGYQWGATSGVASANGVFLNGTVFKAPNCSATFTADANAPSAPLVEESGPESIIVTRRDGVVSPAGVWTLKAMPERIVGEISEIRVDLLATWTAAAATDGWFAFALCRSSRLPF